MRSHSNLARVFDAMMLDENTDRLNQYLFINLFLYFYRAKIMTKSPIPRGDTVTVKYEEKTG